VPIRSSTPTPPDAAAPDTGRLAADLKAEAVRLGFSRVGIAPAVPTPRHDRFRSWLAAGMAGPMAEWLTRHRDLREHPEHLLSGVRSIVMLATDYSTDARPASSAEPARGWSDPDAVVRAQAGHGRVSRYAWGSDYHDVLRARVNRLADWLKARAPGTTCRGVVDSAPLAEREFAWLAGLGWFGKNTMLISPAAGSWFFLTALITDAALPADMPIEVDHCGTCTACLDACPTGALVAPRVLDAGRCISTLTIEDRGPIDPRWRDRLDGWLFGCDVCQEVCPWNRHAPIQGEPAFQPGPASRSLKLADLLLLDDDAFRMRFAGSPLLRAKRRGLLRTAAILLGTTPDPGAREALARALADTDAVVRGAAAWAVGRWLAAGVEVTWAGRALDERLLVEIDPEVRNELAIARAAGAQPCAAGGGLAQGAGREPPPARHPDEAEAARGSQSVSSTSPEGSRPGASSA
jgi:epoxyqueuosine reductase